MESIIKTVLDGDWNTLTKHTEAMAAEKIKAKIEQKKVVIRDRLNAGFEKD